MPRSAGKWPFWASTNCSAVGRTARDCTDVWLAWPAETISATPEVAVPRRSLTRRQFLATAGKAGLVGAAAAGPAGLLGRQPAFAATPSVLSKAERRTLRAAVARIVPA